MKEVTVKTQKQFDKISLKYDGIIRIVGGTEWLNISARPNATIYVSDSATIKYVSGSATIKYVSDSATIKYVSDSATIKYVSGSATIESVSDSATIESVYDSATIKSVSGSATIESVSGSATIKYVSDSATIKYVYDSATIEYVSGYASINFISGRAQVNCFGQNVIRYFEEEKDIKIKKSKGTTVIVLKSLKPTFDSYKTLYPITIKGKKAIFYKAVHKVDGKYVSNYSKSFTYEIGKKKTEKANPTTDESCTTGIHISPLYWAVNFGREWNDLAILECEVPIDKIIVAEDSDGKVRTSELKVLREVPKEEY